MSAAQLIPIENIYYLFCYAWNRFEEAQPIPVGASPGPDLPNLLARVMRGGLGAVLRRGLERTYQPFEDEIATVRGRIDLAASFRLIARKGRRLQCSFDELSHDSAINRILKASLLRLSRAPTLDSELAKELRALAQRFPNVADIQLRRSSFTRIRLHRNNAHYGLLLKIAELAFDCLIPHPSGKGFVFNDVLRDEKKMARVFEEFVRNFYRAEQRTFAVEPLTLMWDAIPLTCGNLGQLPMMRVDIFLRGEQRNIIIDTKYYADALQSYHGRESFHSGNLYQIFSYLKNAAAKHPELSAADGMLLYPEVHSTLDASYLIQGHRTRIATVDLAKPWPQIADRMIQLVS
jgi:5-methylcytosine-specific restriction enzyme subunit McrC